MAYRYSRLFALLAVLIAGSVRAADFDGARAFGDLRDLVKLGPRLPGSSASDQARTLIIERLRQAGWRSEVREAPGLSNVVAKMARGSGPAIFLVTHYDTKRLGAGGSPGANEGASGVAALLEVARQLPSGLKHGNLWLLFCDGSEPTGEAITESDGIAGSRVLVRQLESEGALRSVRAVIFVDLVADLDLHLTPGVPRANELAVALGNAAHALGQDGLVDLTKVYFVPGDHRAFLERGISSVLAFADFEYGGRESPGLYWRTLQDDLRAVSRESLQQSGSLLLTLLKELDR